jgi:hypothetical protein
MARSTGQVCHNFFKRIGAIMKTRKKTVWFIQLNYTIYFSCKGCHSARTAKLAAKRQGGEMYAIPGSKRIPTRNR